MRIVEYNAGIEDSRKYLDALRMSSPISEKSQLITPNRR
jgi:hypothetical protein